VVALFVLAIAIGVSITLIIFKNSDPEIIAKKNSQVIDFLEVYPNAQIEIDKRTSSYVANDLGFNEKCEIRIKSFEEVTLTEGYYEATAWIDKNEKKVVCFYVVNNCVEDWQCSDWSRGDCGERTCNDLNRCDKVEDKPELISECEICFHNWKCGDWSDCIDGKQNRTCNDLNLCNSGIEKKIEEEECAIVTNEEPRFEGLCQEVIWGHNNPDEKRANIVFVGYGYDSYNYESEKIVQAIGEHLIDIGGVNFGLFSLEPFKSNAKKFNFWYINKGIPIDQCRIIGKSYRCYDNESIGNECNFDGKYVINLFDANGGSVAGDFTLDLSSKIYTPEILTEYYCENGELDFETFNCENGCFDGACIGESNDIETSTIAATCNGGDRCLGACTPTDPDCSCVDSDVTSDFLSGKNYYQRGTLKVKGTTQVIEDSCLSLGKTLPRLDLQVNLELIPTFTHEMGHTFGDLRDEYIVGNADELPPEGLSHPIWFEKNCYIGSSEENCLENTQWKDFIGNGCGQPGVIDCTPDDLNYELEIGCFEGCTWGIGSYRPTRTDIMRNRPVVEFGTGTIKTDSYFYGLWNEKLIEDVIKNITNS
jgi:hypothetical protein